MLCIRSEMNLIYCGDLKATTSILGKDTALVEYLVNTLLHTRSKSRMRCELVAGDYNTVLRTDPKRG